MALICAAGSDGAHRDRLERLYGRLRGWYRAHCVQIADDPLIKPLIDIPRMADKSASMLRRALDAFIARDVAAARKIAGEDDEVEPCTSRCYRELLMLLLANPRTIDQANAACCGRHNTSSAAIGCRTSASASVSSHRPHARVLARVDGQARWPTS